MIGVDASLAAKWLFPDEEHVGRALALLRAALRNGEAITGPPLLPIEVTNIVRQRLRRHDISLVTALWLVDRFLGLPIVVSAPVDLHREALALADTFRLPAVYDAHYLALAQRLGCDLWTDDRRLLRDLGGKLPFVRWIGDYRGTTG